MNMKSDEISNRNLVLHCIAERKQGQWQAFCLEYSLAAQGDSFEEARDKLKEQISEYLFDALVGQDMEHAEYFLNRSAPLRMWLKLYFYQAACAVKPFAQKVFSPPEHKPFRMPMPLAPQTC